MDGWETRRRRPEFEDGDHDWAIVRLGTPGVIHGVVVDTAHFTGNYPEHCALEACAVEGHPTPEEIAGAAWVPIVPKSALRGDSEHRFAVDVEQRSTHVRLRIYPDGGVARLRVHGPTGAWPASGSSAPPPRTASPRSGCAGSICCRRSRRRTSSRPSAGPPRTGRGTSRPHGPSPARPGCTRRWRGPTRSSPPGYAASWA
ncbi:hypothetical protein HYQ63_05505 [Streptomyces sp. Rer75]|nr:hypothetical protein HYQ63_05505 [Streptomyces sp. Rer75]